MIEITKPGKKPEPKRIQLWSSLALHVDASSRRTSIAAVQSVARTVAAGLKSSALKRIAATLSP